MLIEAGVNAFTALMTGNEDEKELSQQSEVAFDDLLNEIRHAKDEPLDEQRASEQTPAAFFQLLPVTLPGEMPLEPVSFNASFSDAPSFFTDTSETIDPLMGLQDIKETAYRPRFVAEMFQTEAVVIPSTGWSDAVLEQNSEQKTSQNPEFYSQAAMQSVSEENRPQLLFSMAQSIENPGENPDEIKDDKPFSDLFKQNQTLTPHTVQLSKADLLSGDKSFDDSRALEPQDVSSSEKDAASFDQLLKSEPGREDTLTASGKPQAPFAESMLPLSSSKPFQTRLQSTEAAKTDYQPNIEPKFTVDQSGNKASLRIHQKDIGEITAKIEMNQHSSSVTLIAENAEAKQMIQGQLSQLKAIFNDSNLTLTQASVEEQSSQQDNSQQGQRQAKHHQPGLKTTATHNPDQTLSTARQQQTLIDTYV